MQNSIRNYLHDILPASLSLHIRHLAENTQNVKIVILVLKLCLITSVTEDCLIK